MKACKKQVKRDSATEVTADGAWKRAICPLAGEPARRGSGQRTEAGACRAIPGAERPTAARGRRARAQVASAVDTEAAQAPLPPILTAWEFLEQCERETGKVNPWPAFRAALED